MNHLHKRLRQAQPDSVPLIVFVYKSNSQKQTRIMLKNNSILQFFASSA